MFNIIHIWTGSQIREIFAFRTHFWSTFWIFSLCRPLFVRFSTFQDPPTKKLMYQKIGMILLMATRNSGVHSPVDIINIPFFLQGLYTSKRWLFGISEPSTVGWSMLSNTDSECLKMFETCFPSCYLRCDQLGVSRDWRPLQNKKPKHK